jgi:hypothetical protein
MLMRHFGHGVGHLQYKRQQEIDPDMIAEGEAEEREEPINGEDAEEPEPVNSDDTSDDEPEFKDWEAEDGGGSNCGSESDDLDGGYATF